MTLNFLFVILYKCRVNYNIRRKIFLWKMPKSVYIKGYSRFLLFSVDGIKDAVSQFRPYARSWIYIKILSPVTNEKN